MKIKPSIELLLQKYVPCGQWIKELSSNPSPSAFELIKHDLYSNGRSISNNTNPEAIRLLEANPQLIDWQNLSKNPSAVHILQLNIDKIHRFEFSENTATVHILKSRPGLINWIFLSRNPAAIELLQANPDKICWGYLSMNPAAIHLLKANPSKICWMYLSENPAAIGLLEENLDKVCWAGMSKNPSALYLLEKKPDKICWNSLSLNPNPDSIYLFETYYEKYKTNYRGSNIHNDIAYLLRNPNIFVYDYAGMKANMDILRRELMEKVWTPSRVMRWIDAGCEDVLE